MFSQFDDAEVENYFNRLNAQLRKMPPEDRREMHEELRQHLGALAAAHEELGAAPGEAARAALGQLGEPKRIGRRLFQEWRKTAFPGEREVLPATLTVLLIHFLGTYAMLFGMGYIIAPWVTCGITFEPLWVPFAAGLTAGTLFRRGGMKGVVIGQLFVPVLILAPLMVDYTPTNALQVFLHAQFILFYSALFMALGCAAAFMTGLVRQKKPLFTRWPRFKRASK